MTLYCTSPWTGLFLNTNGEVKSCCSGTWHWGNLKSQSLDAILANPAVQKLKADMLSGRENDYCSNCRYAESVSGHSQRQYYDQVTVTDPDTCNYQLQILDMRWSKLCNLTCVYCSDYFSSSWQEALGLPLSPVRLSYHDQLLKYIDDSSSRIRNVIIAGGEPLLQKQNIRMLESLPADVHINIITNLTINLAHSPVFAMIKDRDNVHWDISLENVGPQYEYVRHRADWRQFSDNLDLLKAHGRHMTFFGVFCLYSISQIMEYYQLAKKYGADIHWQTLIDADHIDVFKFSKPVRDHARDKIRQALSSGLIDSSHGLTFLNQAQQKLAQGPEDTGTDASFRRWTQHHENNHMVTTAKFADLWPELNNLIS
jgi:radical SAM protein with 4Fe4S-binding SPASM domain